MGTLREDRPELFEEPVDPKAIFEAYVEKYPDCSIQTWDEMLDLIADLRRRAESDD